jgi:signal peptidase I
MASASEKRRGYLTGWRGFVVFLVVMLLVRAAVADYNNVPTGSMMPAILIGDRILVDKLAYDLRVPFTLRRIVRWSDPERGDIVTFLSPVDGRLFVKRVIGLPGEVVELVDNVLVIDGAVADYVPLDADEIGVLGLPSMNGVVLHRERFDGTTHVVMLDSHQKNARRHTYGPFQVPPGHYLMLGDNRDHSDDSRSIGPIQRERILGRAHGVAFSLDYEKRYRPRGGRVLAEVN